LVHTFTVVVVQKILMKEATKATASKATASKATTASTATTSTATTATAPHRTPTLVETLCSVWAYLVIAIVCTFFFLLQLMCYLPQLVVTTLLGSSFDWDPGKSIVGRLFRLSSVVSIKLNPLWSFGVLGDGPAVSPVKTVCVANHMSLADTGLLSHLSWEMKYLTKRSMMYLPIIGWMMAISGDVPLSRGNKDSAKHAMKRCEEWLNRGANILIFPEGTRSKDGTLGVFKDGAFRLAIDTQSDLLPIAVYGTNGGLPVDSWKMTRTKALVTVGKPISTRGKTYQDLESLKLETKVQIEQLMSKMAPLCAVNKQHSN